MCKPHGYCGWFCLAQLAACETKSHKRLHVWPCNCTNITGNNTHLHTCVCSYLSILFIFVLPPHYLNPITLFIFTLTGNKCV